MRVEAAAVFYVAGNAQQQLVKTTLNLFTQLTKMSAELFG